MEALETEVSSAPEKPVMALTAELSLSMEGPDIPMQESSKEKWRPVRPKEVTQHAHVVSPPESSLPLEKEEATHQTGTTDSCSASHGQSKSAKAKHSHTCWAGRQAQKRVRSSSAMQSQARGCSRQHSCFKHAAKHRGLPLVGTEKSIGSDSVIDTRVAHQQNVGRLEHQHQQVAADQLVTTTCVMKKGRTATTDVPVGGVGGIPSMVCPIVECSQFFEQLENLARHWGDCQEPYVWYYYCTLCNSRQKLACQIDSHIRSNIEKCHALDAKSAQVATMARPNWSREFHD